MAEPSGNPPGPPHDGEDPFAGDKIDAPAACAVPFRPYCTTRGYPLPLPEVYIWVRAIVWACGRGQTDRHTDARDHNTFLVVYDSGEM